MTFIFRGLRETNGFLRLSFKVVFIILLLFVFLLFHNSISNLREIFLKNIFFHIFESSVRKFDKQLIPSNFKKTIGLINNSWLFDIKKVNKF